MLSIFILNIIQLTCSTDTHSLLSPLLPTILCLWMKAQDDPPEFCRLAIHKALDKDRGK